MIVFRKFYNKFLYQIIFSETTPTFCIKFSNFADHFFIDDKILHDNKKLCQIKGVFPAVAGHFNPELFNPKFQPRTFQPLLPSGVEIFMVEKFMHK